MITAGTVHPRAQTVTINKDIDDSDEERELTNLNWLLRNQSLKWPRTMLDSNANIENENEEYDYKMSVNKINRQPPTKKYAARSLFAPEVVKNQKQSTLVMQHGAVSKHPTPTERYETFINKIKRDLAEYEKSAFNYETDVTEKPPFNYSHIIGMAMLENGRVTLQQICAWIESKFAFFRVRKKWNNSIRHNLSLHYCFRKIDRKREEKGKGGYWELGVDPKKCDRKRIRNRKMAQPKSPRNFQKSKQRFTTEIPSDSLAASELDFCMVDEREHPVTKVAPISKSVQICYRKNAPISELQPEPAQQLYSLTDVSLPSIHSAQIDDTFKAISSFSFFPSTFESVCLQQQQYELGTIIISSSGIVDDSAIEADNDCMRDPNFGSSNTIYKVNDAPVPSENIIVSSHMTVAATTSGDMESNAMDSDTAVLPPVESSLKILNTEDSFPNSAANLTINCDYANFRSYMDGVDETFHYLHNTDITRNEDILDNLLDICIRDY